MCFLVSAAPWPGNSLWRRNERWGPRDALCVEDMSSVRVKAPKDEEARGAHGLIHAKAPGGQ